MNKGSIVERLCRYLIAKNRDINGLLYFSLLYFTDIYLTVISILMETQAMLSNHLTQFCCVQNVQQRPQHGTLWNAEWQLLNLGHLTVVEDLLSTTLEKATNPFEDNSRQAEPKVSQDAKAGTDKLCVRCESIDISVSRYTRRSRTVQTDSTLWLPISSGSSGNWCCRRRQEKGK